MKFDSGTSITCKSNLFSKSFRQNTYNKYDKLPTNDIMENKLIKVSNVTYQRLREHGSAMDSCDKIIIDLLNLISQRET